MHSSISPEEILAGAFADYGAHDIALASQQLNDERAKQRMRDEYGLRGQNEVALMNMREAGDDRRSKANNIALDARQANLFKQQGAMLNDADQLKTAAEYKRLGASPRRTNPDGSLEPMDSYLDRAHGELVGQANAVLQHHDEAIKLHSAAVDALKATQDQMWNGERARITRIAAEKARMDLMADLQAGSRSLLPDKVKGSSTALKLLAANPNSDPAKVLSMAASRMDAKDPTAKAFEGFAKSYTGTLDNEVQEGTKTTQHELFQDKNKALSEQIRQAEAVRKSALDRRDIYTQSSPFGREALRQQAEQPIKPTAGVNVLPPAEDFRGQEREGFSGEAPGTGENVTPLTFANPAPENAAGLPGLSPLGASMTGVNQFGLPVSAPRRPVGENVFMPPNVSNPSLLRGYSNLLFDGLSGAAPALLDSMAAAAPNPRRGASRSDLPPSLQFTPNISPVATNGLVPQDPYVPQPVAPLGPNIPTAPFATNDVYGQPLAPPPAYPLPSMYWDPTPATPGRYWNQRR